MLQKFKDWNIKAKPAKCQVCADIIEYLSQSISNKVYRSVSKHVEEIENCPPPTNVFQLKSHLSLMTFFHRHIPNFNNQLNNCMSYHIKMLNGNGLRNSLPYQNNF